MQFLWRELRDGLLRAIQETLCLLCACGSLHYRQLQSVSQKRSEDLGSRYLLYVTNPLRQVPDALIVDGNQRVHQNDVK